MGNKDIDSQETIQTVHTQQIFDGANPSVCSARNRLSPRKEQIESVQTPKKGDELIVHWFFTSEEDIQIISMSSKNFLDLASVLRWEKHRSELLQPFEKYACKYTDKSFVLDIEKQKDEDLIIVLYKMTLFDNDDNKPTELPVKYLWCTLKRNSY